MIIKKRVCIVLVVFVGEGLSMLITCRFSSLLFSTSFIYLFTSGKYAGVNAVTLCTRQQQQQPAAVVCISQLSDTHTHTATTNQYKRAKTTFIFPPLLFVPTFNAPSSSIEFKKEKEEEEEEENSKLLHSSSFGDVILASLVKLKSA